MGFCRRCGDIVQGARCNKCGGSAVAPAVKWNGGMQKDSPDRWTQTYMTKEKPMTPTTPEKPSDRPLSNLTSRDSNTSPKPSNSPTTPGGRRFPRPLSSTSSPTLPLSSRVSEHIASTTARPTSLLKQSTSSTLKSPPSANDILPSPDTDTLSKVYGSVLQPKETLATYRCCACNTPFPPDATLYPDPSAPMTRFLCRTCFPEHGGSKGLCDSCGKQVLTAVSEGGFVESAGKIWHKRCFRCVGCFKDIGNNPMLDLFGRPSCEQCFDGCLTRKSPSPNRKPRDITSPPATPESRSNPGGMKGKGRDSSATMAELSERLGIKSRENTPLKEEESQSSPLRKREFTPAADRFGFKGSPTNRSPRFSVRESLSSDRLGSQGRHSLTGGEEGSPAAKIRGLATRNSLAQGREGSPSSIPRPVENSPTIRGSRSPTIDALTREIESSNLLDSPTNAVRSIQDPPSPKTRRTSFIPKPTRASTSPNTPIVGLGLSLPDDASQSQTHDLASDFSDSTRSPPTPKTVPYEDESRGHDTTPTAKTTHAAPPLKIPHSNLPFACAQCSQPLLAARGDSRIVTVPGLKPDDEKVHYHADCFRCEVCGGTFQGEGSAVFVRTDSGHVGHPECVPVVVKVVNRSVPSSSDYSSSNKSPFPAPPMTTAIPRFGSSNSCPGCRKSIGPMERGTVPGPQGTRWHATCLVCGGKGARKVEGRAGCGKKLDSGAKTDREGGVFCTECSTFLPASSRPSPQGSPTRSPITPTHTGNMWRFPRVDSGRVVGGLVNQYTGTSGIPKQLTGTAPLKRNHTGGNSASTRSGSPTKGLSSGIPVTRQLSVRPKSVIGIRGDGSKSMDEGRGMFLVRQMTGGGSNHAGLGLGL